MGAAKSVAQPRLAGGLFASVILHGGLVAAFFVLRPGPPPPSPPIYRVQLLAAPPGTRAVGVVRSQPAPVTPPVTTPPQPAPPPKPVAPTPTVTKKVAPRPTIQEKVTSAAKAKSVPRATTPVPKTAAKPPATTAQAPTAGGGPTGGKGADVANVDTPGIEFPYPSYTQNIVRQLILFLGQTTTRYSAEVRFIIRRDGTVDPQSIRIVTPGNYSFDQRALGAVEAAGNARAFGPLPPGFQEDILPVDFRFTPSLIR